MRRRLGYQWQLSEPVYFTTAQLAGFTRTPVKRSAAIPLARVSPQRDRPHLAGSIVDYVPWISARLTTANRSPGDFCGLRSSRGVGVPHTTLERPGLRDLRRP